jgi:hypothetical protein
VLFRRGTNKPSPPPLPPLEEDQIWILIFLDVKHPVAQIDEDIAAAVNISRPTVRAYLNQFRRWNYVERPKDTERKGHTITDWGRWMLGAIAAEQPGLSQQIRLILQQNEPRRPRR